MWLEKRLFSRNGVAAEVTGRSLCTVTLTLNGRAGSRAALYSAQPGNGCHACATCTAAPPLGNLLSIVIVSVRVDPVTLMVTAALVITVLPM